MSRKRPTECGPAHALARRGSFGGKSPANRLVAWKSSKPVRSGSPRLTRFDSGAAPFPVQTHDCNDRRYRTPLASEVRARTPLEPHREPRRNFRRPAQVRWGPERRLISVGQSVVVIAVRRGALVLLAGAFALTPASPLSAHSRPVKSWLSWNAAGRRRRFCWSRATTARTTGSTSTATAGEAPRAHTARLASHRDVPQRGVDAALLRDRARSAARSPPRSAALRLRRPRSACDPARSPASPSSASRAGTYRIACLVPGHEEARMWDVLVVGGVKRPSISTRTGF